MRLAPTATVRVTPRPVERGGPARRARRLLPGSAAAGAFLLDGVPPLGPMEVVVEFPEVASHGQEVTAATRVESVAIVVWAVPWSLLAATAVLLAAVAAVVLARRARLRDAM